MKTAIYKKARITKMFKATCLCCSKDLLTVNVLATAIDGKETNEEIRVCMKCLTGGNQ